MKRSPIRTRSGSTGGIINRVSKKPQRGQASSVSARVEVLKGPAAVLYGRGSTGGILYTLALEVNMDRVTAMLICMTAVFGLRVAAIYWHLSLPTFSLQRN